MRKPLAQAMVFIEGERRGVSMQVRKAAATVGAWYLL